MSGLQHPRYCCVKNCKNNSRNNPNLSFFRFPADEIRCKKWIRNCHRPDLMQKDAKYCYNQLRMCSSHFEDRTFSSLMKNRLKRDAVPTIFEVVLLGISEPQGDLFSRSTQEPNQLMSNSTIESETNSTIMEVQPTCSFHSSDLATTPAKSTKDVLSQTSAILTANVSRKLKMQKKSDASRKTESKGKTVKSIISEEQFNVYCDKHFPKPTANFIKTQLQLRKPISKDFRYPNEFLQFALGIYFISPSAYKFIKGMFKLPTKATLLKVKQEWSVTSGFNKSA